MWSLLWALRPSGLDDEGGRESEPRTVSDPDGRRAVVDPRTLAAENGSHDGDERRSTPSDVSPASFAPSPATVRAPSPLDAVCAGAARVSVSVCPGGIFLTDMDLERARAQFDLSAALRFTSKVEAELACAGLVGFLLEIPRIDGEPAILFARTLRD